MPGNPSSQGPGDLKGGPSGVLEPQQCIFGFNFLTKKLQGTPKLVGVGHLIGPQIWVWKNLGPVCFWSHGTFPRRLYEIKVVVNVPNSAWPQGQGIGKTK